jgi:hypothetical protein
VRDLASSYKPSRLVDLHLDVRKPRSSSEETTRAKPKRICFYIPYSIVNKLISNRKESDGFGVWRKISQISLHWDMPRSSCRDASRETGHFRMAMLTIQEISCAIYIIIEPTNAMSSVA